MQDNPRQGRIGIATLVAIAALSAGVGCTKAPAPKDAAGAAETAGRSAAPRPRPEEPQETEAKADAGRGSRVVSAHGYLGRMWVLPASVLIVFAAGERYEPPARRSCRPPPACGR